MDGFYELLLFQLFLLFVSTIPFRTIFKRAGFSWWLWLLMFVPIFSVVVLYIVAYSDWHVEAGGDFLKGLRTAESRRIPRQRHPDA